MNFSAHNEMDKQVILAKIAVVGQYVATGGYADAVAELVKDGRIVRKPRSRREIYVMAP